jgi:cytochrome P450
MTETETMAAADDPAQILGALMEPAGRDDPYPLYAALRAFGPLVPLEEGGLYLCPGYEEINAVLRSPEFGGDTAGKWSAEYREQLAEIGLVDYFSYSILESNDPDHRRVRSLVSSAFTPRRIASFEPDIARLTDRLLDALAETAEREGGTVDFMEHFAFSLPVTVICEMLGVPEADRPRFRPLAHELTTLLELSNGGLDGLESVASAENEVGAYFRDLAEQRRAEPRDDLISALVQVSSEDDGTLTDLELIANVVLLLVAGFETTTNLIGNGLYEALRRPALLEGLGKGEIPVKGFVEEVLRYDSPVQMVGRYALTDTASVAGRPIPKGEEVLLFMAAAHRDPRRFAEPDSFDPARPDNVPLSFGDGIHYCLGQGLARLEARIAFEKLFARFPGIASAGAAERGDRLVLRGYRTLPVSLV